MDELRLLIYAFILGSGERLITETTGKLPLRLTANRTRTDRGPALQSIS